MDNQLLSLRQAVYDSAAQYHSAVSDTLRLRPGQSKHTGDIPDRLRATAAKYEDALNKLVLYLESMESNPVTAKEFDTVSTKRGMLQREIRLLT